MLALIHRLHIALLIYTINGSHLFGTLKMHTTSGHTHLRRLIREQRQSYGRRQHVEE